MNITIPDAPYRFGDIDLYEVREKNRIGEYNRVLSKIFDVLLNHLNPTDLMTIHLLKEFHQREVTSTDDLLNRCDVALQLYTHMIRDQDRETLIVHTDLLRRMTYLKEPNSEMSIVLNILFNELIVSQRIEKDMEEMYHLMIDYFTVFLRFFRYEVVGMDLGFTTTRLLY